MDLIAELAMDANVTKVEDIMKIMEYGIIHTPGLVIDEKVILSDKLPSTNEL